MLLTIDAVLTPDELLELSNCLGSATFVDGKLTAGWHAQLVKHNTQLGREDPILPELKTLVKTALSRHPLFQAAAQPHSLHTVIFSRYETGMSYGTHVDNALMGREDGVTNRRYRSDISWTLFCSDPDTYEGGALVIQGSEGEQAFKLQAGAMVLYPSSYLHRVETVTDGVRLATVGWVQSLIRDPAQREILFDLDAARRSLFRQYGKTPEFDLLSKTYANLLRQWVEV
jgi:PKHD-type hydroxylase